MVNSAYARAAVEALVRWNKMDREEAERVVAEKPREELEKMCWAEGSVKAGFQLLMRKFRENGVEISPEQEQEYYSVILDGPEDSPLMAELSGHLQGMDRKELAKEALVEIHDNWVRTKEGKLIESFVEGSKRAGSKFMHTPLELIGWETVESDYVFLESVMQTMGISMPREEIKAAYEEMQAAYMDKNNIHSKEDLAKHVAELPNNYEAVSGYSPESKKLFESKEMADQVYKESGFEHLQERAPSSLAKKAQELQAITKENTSLDGIPVPEVEFATPDHDHDDE